MDSALGNDMEDLHIAVEFNERTVRALHSAVVYDTREVDRAGRSRSGRAI